MAPINGSAKSRRQTNTKLAQQPKPVVPALPLPYIKRQAAAAAAAAAATTPANTARIIPQYEKKLTNGASAPGPPIKEDGKAINVEIAAAVPAQPEPADSAAKPVDQKAVQPHPRNGAQTSNGAANAHQASPAASTSEQASITSELDDASKAPTTTTSDHSDQPTAGPEPITQVTTENQNLANSVPAKHNGVPAKIEMKAELPYPAAKHPAKIRPPPAVSPTRYQMPPPFQPGNRPMGLPANGDLPRAHRLHMPNGPHLHQPHPSNGSIHFGGFHGSASSSPAPPLSGGIAPPPGLSGPEGRPHYMGHPSNGFPPMVPYGADMVPVTTFDNYARPAMAYGPMDAYPPYGHNFGPSTPHSFHESQSSAHPEDNGIHLPYPAPPARNGATGPGDDSHNLSNRIPPGAEQFGVMPNHGPHPHMVSPMDPTGGWASHMWNYFNKDQFADCNLGLQIQAEPGLSLHIPAHRIVLARSPRLASLLTEQSSQRTTGDSNSYGLNAPLLLVEARSKWIRPELFSKALSRLYGSPDPFNIPPSESPLEQLDYALSYAAAGHLLMWDQVIREGCGVALQLINWQTLERAVEFALEAHVDKGSYDNFKYEHGSRMILDAVINYIISNVPPNFAFDASVAEPEGFRRFPSTPTPPSTPSAQKHSSPAIAHGSSVHLGRPRRSQQITSIQFGDLPPFQAIASRILLTVPFGHLKRALESPGSNNGNGWANAEYRYRIIKDVVAERERRRIHAVEAIRGGRVPGWEHILNQLSTPEPRYFNEWSAVGWREEMLPYGNPPLGRAWAPLMAAQAGSTAEYP